MRRSRIVLVAILLHGACSLVAFSADDKPVPEDLKIVAQYGAGLSDWKSWKYTIEPGGMVSQEIYDSGDNPGNKTKLSEGAVRSIWSKIEEARFFDLQERYSGKITDCPTLVLTVTANKKTRRVVVYAPTAVKERDAVARFDKVWSEILRKLPSPNPEQKPDSYKP
jgi:hypothetical protein